MLRKQDKINGKIYEQYLKVLTTHESINIGVCHEMGVSEGSIRMKI